MECVLADEAQDMGGEFGEYNDSSLAVLVSLFGDINPDPDPPSEEAEAEVAVPTNHHTTA